MSTIFISEKRPAPIDARAVKWLRPIKGETLASFANGANSLLCSRGFAHITKTFDYDRDSGNDGQDLKHYLFEDTDGLNYSYHLILPQKHPMATHIALMIVYQGHDAGTSPPQITISATTISGGAIDPAAGGSAVVLSKTSGDIADGGRVFGPWQSAAGDSMGDYQYPIRVAYCLGVNTNISSYPTAARAIDHSSVAAGGDVKITLATQNVRILTVTAVEIPRAVVAQ